MGYDWHIQTESWGQERSMAFRGILADAVQQRKQYSQVCFRDLLLTLGERLLFCTFFCNSPPYCRSNSEKMSEVSEINEAFVLLFFFLSSDITAIPRYWLFVSSTKDRTEKTPFNGLNIWVMISVIYSLQRCWRAWSSLCVCVCGQKRLIHDTAKKSEGETCKWI